MMYWLRLVASFFGGSVKAVKCGHRSRKSGRISAFGDSVFTHLKANSDGTLDYCLACLGKMAIQCSLCKRAIFVGDPIALYHGTQASAVIVGPTDSAHVGCMFCTDSAANHSGFWVPDEDGKGQVQRILNGFERALLAPDC